MTKKPRNRSLIALLLTLAMLLSLVPSTAFAQKIEVSRADFFGFEKPVLTSTKDNNYFTNLIKTTSRDPYRVEFVALKKEGGATVALPHTFTQEGNYIAEYKVIIDGTNFANHMFSANPVWAVKTITGKQINSSTPAITQNTGDSSSFIMSVPFKVENEVLLNAPPTNLRIDVASDSVKAKFDAPQSNKAYSAKLYLLRNGEPHPIDMSDTIEKNIMANAPQNTEEWNITDKVKKSGKYTVVLVYKPEGSSDYLYGSKMESTIYEPQAYPLTITNGGVLGGSPDNKYVPGEQLRIAAADPQAGQVFDKWEVVSGTVTLADATQKVTTFTMPASPVTLKATYKTVKYLVTLENGTLANSPPADGKYAQGETVSIVANPTPPGQVFDKWVVVNGTGVVFADETSAQTSFTMPANEVKVKATYKNAPAATKYLVTVENGTLANNPPADGKYAQGVTVTVQANAAPSGQVFDKWEVVTGGVTLANATQASTTFTMPAGEVKVKATYKNAPAATKYLVTVENGTLANNPPADGKYAQGATVTVQANAAPSGQVFDKWEVVSGGVTLANATQASTTFTMPAGEVKVKATYKNAPAATKYLVTVENGTLANNPPADGKYAQGVTVTVQANAAPSGQVFDKWEVVTGGVTLANATQASTTFTMPAGEVKVKATYKNAPAATKYLVTVENGTLANNPPADGKYAQGATVTVQANAAPSGQVFDKWEVVSGGVTLANATQASTTFTMPAGEVKVKATYKNAPAATKYLVTVENGTLANNPPADGKYAQGATVTVQANAAPSGQVFDKWEVVSGGVTLANATQASTTFTMPANEVKVKATYKLAATKYLVTVENGTLANNPPADGKYAQGATVTVQANAAPSGQVFDKWEVVSGGVTLANATQASTTFTMPANEVKVKATYKLAATKYLVTVENGTLANNPPADGKYAQGATVTVQANAAPSGQVFDKWEVVSGGVTLANATQASTTFTMPAGEVKVKATYKNAPAAPTTYTVTVLDGTGGGNYAQNATVTITANAASAGKIFDKWEVLEGNVTLGNTTHSTTTFSMPANAVKVKAVYRDLVAPSMTSSSTYYHPELNNQPSKKPDVPKVKPSPTKPKAPEVTESGKANAKNLTDINNHWANSAITYCVERNIMRGMSEKTFAPNTSVTRGMFVTILGNLSDVDKASYNVGKFSDSVGKYYSPYVNWANETGIAQGVSSDKFMPNTAITREQLAVMIVKYAKHANIDLGSNSPQKVFTDANSISPWAKDAVSTLQMSGIMEGQNGNRFNPKAKATRAEVCLIMQKLTTLIDK